MLSELLLFQHVRDSTSFITFMVTNGPTCLRFTEIRRRRWIKNNPTLAQRILFAVTG